MKRRLSPCYSIAKGLLQESQLCSNADIIIFTNGEPIDAQRLAEPCVRTLMQESMDQYHTEISVIAMCEQYF